MAGTAEGFGPSYISSHSADVILSDIQPTKLQIDALRSVNVLLDEFLYNILSTCRSLSTDKLRAGLLKVLPTSLGKEALLEAEVELRAYWDRTNLVGSSYANGDDQGKTFHLQWAFELLRLKCEAYSTLNESDEDPEAENRLQSRMGQSTGLSPPKAVLVAPAALYLTAILEALCEHILSNVGRVVARDSSKTSATVEDLFVALCEDDSIYGLFKSMKVYEQIEALSVLPKPRRSKSLSRNNDRPHISQRESTPKETQGTATPPRSRMSSDSSVAMTAATISPAPNRRSSLDKTRAMKMFMANNRSSLDPDGGDGQGSHKKSDSILSEAYSMYDESEKSFEDAALLQEFDNLMRSDSTLKVSLTPDRLKTMDVFNKEKGQRGARRPLPKVDLSASEMDSGAPAVSSVPPSRVNGRPPPPNVDPIVEDEEEANVIGEPQPSATRSRQASVTSATSSRTRLRSISTSSPLTNNNPTTQPSRNNGSPFPSPPYSSINAQKLPNGPSSFPSPARTRRVAHNRESLDLDDVMTGSDNEEQEVKKAPETPLKRPRPIPYAVSPSTRDLMDFLDQGPPDEPAVTPPMVKSGRHLLEVLAEGSTNPHKANASRSSLQTNSKGSGRFQRMMAKLSMRTSSEKLRNNGSGDDTSKTPSTRMHPHNPSTPTRPSLPFKRSVGNLTLANKPIPPRPPPISPISPPSSPSQESLDVPVLHASFGTRTLATRVAPKTLLSAPERRESHSKHVLVNTPPPPPPPVNGHSNHIPAEEGMTATKPSSTITAEVDPCPEKTHLPILPTFVVEPTSKGLSTKLVAETTQKPPPSQLSADDALAMHRLFSNATTADECRLIFDMFLTRSGLPAADYEIPYPSPSPSDLPQTQPSVADVELEHSLVELLLGDSYTIPTRKRRRKPVPALEDLSSESIHAPGSN